MEKTFVMLYIILFYGLIVSFSATLYVSAVDTPSTEDWVIYSIIATNGLFAIFALLHSSYDLLVNAPFTK